MRPRLNIRQLKTFIWVACLGLFAYDGWTFFEIYQKKEGKEYAPRAGELFGDMLHSRVEEAPQVTTGQQHDKDRYEKLWLALVEGSDPNYVEPEAVAGTDKPVEVKPTLKAIEDVVEVSLVFYSPDPLSRFVALTYLGDDDPRAADGKQRRLHLREGEALKAPYDEAPYNAVIKEITEQQVVFNWGDEDAVLDPGLGRADRPSVPLKDFEIPLAGANPAEAYDAPPDDSVYVEEGVWVMGTNDLDDLAANAGDMLGNQVKIRSRTPSQGERSVLEITSVDENSLVFKYGGRAGDKIISVNGFPMTSTAAAVNWFKANDNLPSYVVKYERQGQTKTTTIHVPEK